MKVKVMVMSKSKMFIVQDAPDLPFERKLSSSERDSLLKIYLIVLILLSLTIL